MLGVKLLCPSFTFLMTERQPNNQVEVHEPARMSKVRCLHFMKIHHRGQCVKVQKQEGVSVIRVVSIQKRFLNAAPGIISRRGQAYPGNIDPPTGLLAHAILFHRALLALGSYWTRVQPELHLGQQPCPERKIPYPNFFLPLQVLKLGTFQAQKVSTGPFRCKSQISFRLFCSTNVWYPLTDKWCGWHYKSCDRTIKRWRGRKKEKFDEWSVYTVIPTISRWTIFGNTSSTFCPIPLARCPYLLWNNKEHARWGHQLHKSNQWTSLCWFQMANFPLNQN